MSFHFYTTSSAELNQVLEEPGAVSEGITCYVRFHSLLYEMHNTKTGHHFYTTSPFVAGLAPSIEPLNGYLQNPEQWVFDGVVCEVLQSADLPNELPTEFVVQMLNPGIGDYLYFAAQNDQQSVALQEGAQASGYGYPSVPFTVPMGAASQVVPFNRFLNPINHDHYYSISAQAPPGYGFELVAFNVFQATPFGTPLYRLRSNINGDHVYTTDTNELDEIYELGYTFESIACQVLSQPQPNTTPLFRLRNPASGDHLLTTSDAERITAAEIGYLSDEITCEVYPVQVPYTTPLYRVRRE